MANDAGEARHLIATEAPAVIVLAAGSLDQLQEACRTLRAAPGCEESFILATGSRPGELQSLLEAGADDFLIEQPGDELLQAHLWVAERAAAGRSARRTAEQDSAQFFRLSLQLLCIAGFDGRFKRVNPVWTQLLGWSPDELLTKPWLDFVHPDDRAATIAAGSQLQEGRAVISFVNRYLCKDGSYRWLEWQAAPVLERGVIHAVAHDITEAVASREALRQLSEDLATTLDSIGDAVIATGVRGEVARMNPVAERLTTWTFAQARGRPVQEILALVDEESRARVENPIARTLREGVAAGMEKPALLLRRDGTSIPIAETCAPIRAAGGELRGAVLVLRDMSARRDAELTRKQFEKQLVFADRMASVGTLAAGVAHEINNPLSYVATNLELGIEEVRALGGGSPSGRMEELQQLLLEAREGLTRVSRIVRGLKTFSRIEEERRSVIDLFPVIELSINMAYNELRHRARVVKEYGPVPLVEADDARLGQVFINLLINASHAFADRPAPANEIRVVTSTDGAGRAVVEIRDNGVGIPPAVLGRIFDPFFTTKPVGVGTGLGLAISHNIVTGLGGEITVHSEPGAGASFRVALPPSRAEAPTPLGSTAPRPRPAAVASVLVVDDEQAIGGAIRRLLREHEVTAVTRAQDALDLLASGRRFQLVVSDLMMPVMSGMELYAEIARRYPETAPRMVFLTGGAFTPEANAFLDRVPNERMEKPFDPNALRELVSRLAR